MTNIKNVLAALLVLLKSAIGSAYYKQPIPSEIDKGINKILEEFAAFDQVDMKQIADGVSGDDARVLGFFAERMASLAVRENSIAHLKQGVVALLIYAQTEDPRDVVLVLSLLHDAGIKISGNPKQVFNEVSSVIGDAQLLSGFLARSDEDKSINAMGYEESESSEGFLYTRNW